jgi:hypothetical protein
LGSKALGGVTVLQKGAEDIIITNTKGVFFKEAHETSKTLNDIPKSS